MHKVYFNADEHRYFLDKEMTKEVPGVSSLLEHFGYSDFDGIRSIVGDRILDKASNYGTVVHETLKLLDEGRLDEYDPLIEAEVRAWERFKNDYSPDFLIIEEPLVSRAWGFAGTPDRYWMDNLCDVKTGASSPAHHLQTALYKILIEENYPAFKVRSRFTVQLKNGDYKITPHKDRKDEMIVKCLLTIYNDKKRKGLLNGSYSRNQK